MFGVLKFCNLIFLKLEEVDYLELWKFLNNVSVLCLFKELKLIFVSFFYRSKYLYVILNVYEYVF